MPSELWGTLSVRDHLNAQLLIADLLLYDRLVFPVFSGNGERVRWRHKGWKPDLQECLIEKLGPEVTLRAEWNKDRERQYRDLRNARKDIAKDAYQATRLVLATDNEILPLDRTVRAVAAYHDVKGAHYQDGSEAQCELGLEKVQPDHIALGKLAFVVGRELLMPKVDPTCNPNDLVLRAKELSLEPKFREKRQEFYKWLEDSIDLIAKRRRTVPQVISELSGRAEELNSPIKNYFVRKRLPLLVGAAFTVVGVVLPTVLGVNQAIGLVGLVPGAFDLLGFGTERLVDARADQTPEAAAMIVSARALGS